MPVKIDRHENVGIIELNRPDQFNCMSMAAFALIDQARRDFEADPDIRAILIQATGKNFCTGADLSEVLQIRQSEKDLSDFLAIGHDALLGLESSPLPVIAAVQGLCLAGGLELMLACDVVFAAQSAQFGDQHAQFGLVPGWGGSQRLPRLIGLRRAMDMFLSAQWISAETALSFGLINKIAEDALLIESALSYCQKLAQKSPIGLAEMKELAHQGLNGNLSDGLALERKTVLKYLQSETVTEGLDAFKSRRPPHFPSV
ncbi:MAG: enoyl-CoA hydratase [Sneathiella sp.]|nr:MAG: enoyl-CoA hydratase [Sneathiella sp.]